MAHAPPFADFSPKLSTDNSLGRAIVAAYRLPEPEAVEPLLAAATLPDEDRTAIAALATRIVERLRAKELSGGLDALVREYSLSTDEGVALMCLAEALLRVPDNATRDALIRDKIAKGDWRSHLGEGRSIFVNAATWGLVVSGKLVGPAIGKGLGPALTGLIGRAGEPVIRSAVNLAIEMMGDQFVTGETIEGALKRSREMEKLGFSYSYDMLGEAAMTWEDAESYYSDYESAIHSIGKLAAGKGVYAGAGISIKLSALHPRYERSQAGRVMSELVPRVQALALLAKRYDIGLNIDAEEADRLDLSLNVLEALALDEALSGWQGLGFVVQAYSKRCPFVIDWIVDLAQRSERRIMVRLVKGAYWDSEMKRAQVDGLSDFPVFTRKVHTDVSYLACAKKLLMAKDKVFPQFATHNAQTLASIYHLAGDDFAFGDYEFQCLHGMGEDLYREVVGPDKLGRPCRIYAPVGNHEKLLAYLVRRLLENGANSSFVNRIHDENVPIADLVKDPVDEANALAVPGSPNEHIQLPSVLFPDRANSRGLDFSDEQVLAKLSNTLKQSVERSWQAVPLLPNRPSTQTFEWVLNPSDHRDRVGQVEFADASDVDIAMQNATSAFPGWASTPAATRAQVLDCAADALEEQMEELLGLIMREAGKTAPNAVAEVREAVDFLRYYAQQARDTLADAEPLGPIVCISPWNFPLAIFLGQVAAALVAGNTVIAKPAEETPLIAAQAIQILHEAGAPKDVLQFITGDGGIGAALVSAPETCGVIFTGSTEVAKLIQKQLASRTLPDGSPIPLIAETGGQNAMIVDSTALPEQVVRDVLTSAFDSAGQRCSALRLLCLQEDIADQLLAMLHGAMRELLVAPTDQHRADVGPVISSEAQAGITSHIEKMRGLGVAIEQLPLCDAAQNGTFVPPTIIELSAVSQLGSEVFGPVLHVVRYKQTELGTLIEQINETGYGLTFGVHSRIDETVSRVTSSIKVGNIYVNRNTVGAIVGSQPFGGRGMSGTGPKAGGPLYLGRMLQNEPQGFYPVAGDKGVLPGPVGERNVYEVRPKGKILLFPFTKRGLRDQLDAVRDTGNIALIQKPHRDLGQSLAAEYSDVIEWIEGGDTSVDYDHVLIEDLGQAPIEILKSIAARDGPIPIVQVGGSDKPYRRNWMFDEVCVSTDTTAAGGNASLMAIS